MPAFLKQVALFFFSGLSMKKVWTDKKSRKNRAFRAAVGLEVATGGAL